MSTPQIADRSSEGMTMATHSPATILGPADHGRIVSAEEFAEADFAEPWTYEREDGRLVVMAPDGGEHVRDANSWRDRLVMYKMAHPEIVDDVVSGAWVRVDGE